MQISLSSLLLKPNQTFMMVGCADKAVLINTSELSPEEVKEYDVANDLDWYVKSTAPRRTISSHTMH